jgi:hypothetical protein
LRVLCLYRKKVTGYFSRVVRRRAGQELGAKPRRKNPGWTVRNLHRRG